MNSNDNNTVLVPEPTAKDACRHYREYIQKHYGEDYELGHKSYLFTRADVKAALNEGDIPLDGIRIYIGHTDKGDAPLVRLYMVGVRQNGERYDDVLDDTPALAEGKSGVLSVARTVTTAEASVRTGRPCPHQCSGTTNELNS